jgi:PAS domain S-box-containing protein
MESGIDHLNIYSYLDDFLEGCQIIGFDLRYKYINKTGKQHTRFTGDHVGMQISDAWPGIIQTLVYTEIRKCLEDRKPRRLKDHFGYHDGNRSSLELSLQPVPEGVLILSVDITALENSETELLIKDEHFRSMFEQATDGIFVADENGNYTDVNNQGCEMLGYTRDEILKLNITNIITNDEIPRVATEIERLKKEKLARADWKFLRKDKSVFLGEVTSKLLSNGHLQAFLKDITDYRMAEQALLESESKFKNLVSAMQVGVVIQGPGSQVLLCNPKALELLDVTEDQFLGRTSFDPGWNVIREDGTPFPALKRPAFQAITTRKPVREVIMGVHRPTRNDIMWLLVDSLPQLNYDGTVRQVISTFIDINKRKAAEEALKKSEDLFNKAFHGSPSPMTIANQEDGRYIAVNDSFLRLVELPREEVIGKTGSSLGLIDEESRSLIRSQLAGKKLLHNFEVKARSKSGRPLYLLTSIENTNLAGVPSTIATMLDITERKLAEEALIESENKFRKIYEEGPFGMAMVNKDLKFININSTFSQIVGYTEEELKKLSVKDITYESNPGEMEELKKLIRGEIPVYRTEKRYRRKDGNLIWGSLTVAANISKDGRFLYNLAIIEDISARKKAEEDLVESKAYLDAALSSMTDAVFISNRTGEFVLFNDGFAKFHRFPDKETCSKQFAEYPDILNVFFANGEPAPVNMWAVPRALRGDIASNEVYILERKDTQERWVGSYSFSPIHDKNGEIMGSVVVGRDITDQIDKENRIRELNETLEQKVEERTAQLKAVNKELEAFSYSVSHDLRAPLRSINGFTQILLEDYAPFLDAEGKRICNVIQHSSRSMGRLIDELLAFSRLNRSEIKKSRIRMKELVLDIYGELIRLENNFSAISFNVDDINDADGDPEMIKQVWINLISNALKYSSRKEKIEISVTGSSDERFSTYCIKDNGEGFDMQFSNKLFGVFQRLHSNSDFEGTGVGLAIVQRIILRHGGDVSASAEVGKGAEFCFTLPKNDILS